MSSSEEHTTRASDENLASARPGDPNATVSRPSGRASTIIVDPELMEEARRLSERPPAQPQPEPAAATERTSDEPNAAAETAHLTADANARSTHEDEDHGVQLSDADADRLADSFRPSWEPPAPVAPPAEPAIVAHAAPEARPILMSEVPGARPRSGLLMAGGAVLGFLALAVLGWAATHTDAPPEKPATAERASAPSPPKPVPVKSQPAHAAPAPSAPAPAPAIAPAPEIASTAPAQGASTPVETAAAQPAAAIEPPVSPALEPPKPEPVLVALRITTSPREAKLVLDGATVPNPYDALLPKGESYEVAASAPGYEGRTLTIELERERRVALELERERKAAPEPAPKAAKPARKRSRPARTPAAEPKKGAAFVEESPY